MWKTPGTWNDIPADVTIRASHGNTTIEGRFVALTQTTPGDSRTKRITLQAYGLGRIWLDARDQWEVQYESLGFDEVVSAAPVGTVWRVVDESYPRFVKVSETHVTKQAFRSGTHSTPEVFPILQFGGPADGFVEITRNVLAEAAER